MAWRQSDGTLIHLYGRAVERPNPYKPSFPLPPGMAWPAAAPGPVFDPKAYSLSPVDQPDDGSNGEWVDEHGQRHRPGYHESR